MYQDMYERWLAAELDDADLKPELESVKGDDAAIQDRFAVALKFGTAGLRGVIGAGTNRMNIYVVRQATQGLANWVKTQGGSQTVAISYDSRIKSNLFAKTAAEVLAANGIKVRIYSALMPVPALSFATRYYNCNAGIMVTASHNPAKYNGYKAYGPDGCQMTDEAADIVYAEIQKTDILTGAKLISFEDGLAQGLIEYVGNDCINALYAAIEARSIRPGICKTAGLKLVYSPLNGSGLVPVTHVLGDIGITDITIVPEQKDPDGNFPTCPYPNPEIFEALRLGLELAEKSGADLMLATDPDADRVGIAVKCKDGSYELLSGNEVGVLLLDFIAQARIKNGKMPKDPVAVTTIVSTDMADAVAKEYGIEMRRVLTGFKYIGDQIASGGQDVLVFSLEMARAELMAKSISRHTLTLALARKWGTACAKTARGVTDGRRYAQYGEREREVIRDAVTRYGEYAGHLFIAEGVGDIGVTAIRERIARHIDMTGKTPLVIVDYLQIVAPYNERATDKQNMDKAVLELKRISRDFKLPVIAVSSLNRMSYGQRISMEAFKESGAIEYSSDVLIGLQLRGAGEATFDPTGAKKKNPRQIEAVILKNRNGRVGEKIEFEYYPMFNYFTEKG